MARMMSPLTKSIQVVLRLPDNGADIESVQDSILDALYAAGFNRIEPVSATLVDSDTSDWC